MNHQCYNVIGVMSGTSLDAIDIVSMELVRSTSWSFQVKAVKSLNYCSDWKARLAGGVGLDDDELTSLNLDYTHYLTDAIKQFILTNQIDNILAVCSHGHTIRHQPVDGITLQIGNLPDIGKLIGLRTICNFRVQDVGYGGQGAPLVPIGDKLLFSEYDYCLNLGGFANISFDKCGERIAYDVSPVNVVLNFFANKLGAEYDDKGAFAKAGEINIDILNQLNELDFYNLQAPKSLGMEWVNAHIWGIIDEIDSPQNALATFTEHIAIQIADSIKVNAKVLVTGGGAYNEHLIKRIEYHLKSFLIIPDSNIIEYKEALIFGLLGVLRLRNENNCLASVTGAIKDHSSGEIYLP